jgi:hypothetical protein
VPFGFIFVRVNFHIQLSFDVRMDASIAERASPSISKVQIRKYFLVRQPTCPGKVALLDVSEFDTVDFLGIT